MAFACAERALAVDIMRRQLKVFKKQAAGASTVLETRSVGNTTGCKLDASD